MSVDLKVVIDWNNDGLFTGQYDDITADLISIDWSLGMRQMYQPIADESTCNITLQNLDGKYLPENTLSPLFGNMVTNRRIKILYVDGLTEEHFWTGWIEFIKPTWLVGNVLQPVVITGTGFKRQLQEQQVALEIFSDVTGDVIIADILAQVQPPPAVGGILQLDHPIFGMLPTYLGEPSVYSDIETGLTVFPTYGDLQPPKALEAIAEVTAGEQGRFFLDRLGRAIWWNRHHLLRIVADDAVVNTQGGPYKPVDMDYVYGQNIANVVRITSNPRTVGSGSVVMWEMETPMTIATNATEKIECWLRNDKGQFAGTSALTPAPTFSSGFATITVIKSSGSAQINISNASSSVPAVLASLELTGVPTNNSNQMDVVAVDDDSAAIYGIKEIAIDLGTISDFETAKNVAAFELGRRRAARGNVLSLAYDRKFDGIDNQHMIDWEIGTRLLVEADELAHEYSYFVISEKHSWNIRDRDRSHKTVFTLEPANTSEVMILDDVVFGRLDQNVLTY